MADENTPVSAPHSSGPSSSGPSSGPGQRSGGRPSGGPGGGRKFFRRKKVCKFCTERSMRFRIATSACYRALSLSAARLCPVV